MGHWSCTGKFAMLALLLTLLAVSIAGATGARTLIGEDDFTLADGDPPDPDLWTVVIKDPDNTVYIDNGNMRIEGKKDTWPSVGFSANFTTDDFTVLLDWKPVTTDRNNNMISMGVHTKLGDGYTHRSYMAYDTYWGWTTVYTSGNEREYLPSYDTDVEFGEWYTINLTVHDDLIDVTATRRTTGRVVYEKRNVVTDEYQGDNKFFISLDGSTSRFDNFRLYDNQDRPNVRPSWTTIPTFSAVEDVPLAVDLSPYVIDPDDGLENLSIMSSGPYVVSVDDMVLTLAFPDGVLKASVPVTVSDGRDDAGTWIQVVVEPVVEPPTLVIVEPQDGSVFKNGTSVIFTASLQDPDRLVGEDATVTWSSNLSGELLVGSVDGALTFTTSLLPVGTHTIEVDVDDGVYAVRASLEIEMREAEAPPDGIPDDDGDDPFRPLTGPISLLIIVLVSLALLLATIWVSYRRRVREMDLSGPR